MLKHSTLEIVIMIVLWTVRKGP